MAEKDFWGKIRQQMLNGVLGLWLRIENGVSAGMPDCVVLCEGNTTFVELKSREKLTRDIGLTALQVHWLNRWAMLGGQCYVFLQVRGHSKKEQQYLIIPGQKVVQHVREPEDWIELSIYYSTEEVDWNAVKGILS